jgi:hypothetical protein
MEGKAVLAGVDQAPPGSWGIRGRGAAATKLRRVAGASGDGERQRQQSRDPWGGVEETEG